MYLLSEQSYKLTPGNLGIGASVSISYVQLSSARGMSLNENILYFAFHVATSLADAVPGRGTPTKHDKS